MIRLLLGAVALGALALGVLALLGSGVLGHRWGAGQVQGSALPPEAVAARGERQEAGAGAWSSPIFVEWGGEAE